MTADTAELQTDLAGVGHLDAIYQSRTGNAIQRLRHARSLTQQELAELIGAEPNSISRWERGVTRPHAPMRRALAEALLCTIEDLKLTLTRPPAATKPTEFTSPIAEVWLRADGPRFTAMFVHANESTTSRPVAHRTGAGAQREITGYLVQCGYQASSAWVTVSATESTRKFQQAEGGEPR